MGGDGPAGRRGGDPTGPASGPVLTAPRAAYTVTACALLRREGCWLLTVRAAGVDDAPGSLGLVGGHVEDPRTGSGVLESTARRETYEETGVDLTGVVLTYLESEYFHTDAGVGQISVSYVASAPDLARPHVRDPSELSEVGWWSVEAARTDPRCPAWLPELLQRADRRLGPDGTDDPQPDRLG